MTRIFLIFILALALLNHSFGQVLPSLPAQTDTIIEYEFDTIEVQEAPVVIKRSVVVVTGSEEEKEHPWAMEIAAGPVLAINRPSSKLQDTQFLLNRSIQPKIGYQFMGTVFYHKHHLEGILSAGFTSLSEKLIHATTLQEPNTKEVTDTVTYYYVVNGNDTNTIYVTEPRSITDTIQHQVISIGNASNNYLKLAGELGYSISKNNWTFTGRGGFQLLSLLSSVKSKLANQEMGVTASDFLLGYKLGVGIDYRLTDMTAATVQCWGAGDLNPYLSGQNFTISRFYSGINFGIKYFL